MRALSTAIARPDGTNKYTIRIPAGCAYIYARDTNSGVLHVKVGTAAEVVTVESSITLPVHPGPANQPLEYPEVWIEFTSAKAFVIATSTGRSITLTGFDDTTLADALTTIVS